MPTASRMKEPESVAPVDGTITAVLGGRFGRSGGRHSRQLGERHHGRPRQHARCDGVDHVHAARDASTASNIESH